MIAEVMKMREEENKRSSRVKRFFKKRWVFPAIYIAGAAIILTAVLWYQTSDSATDKYGYKSTDIASKKHNQPSLEVNKTFENFKMPVANAASAVIKTKFYDFSGKTEDQEAALVFYNNTYEPNQGIDITMKDDKTFDVVASLSGTVTRVEEDSVLGNVIEITHDKGIVTQYQSVTDMAVKVGDKVNQGQILAKAGQSLFNEKAGTHVHFEIRKDDTAVNPTNYFDKPLSTLQSETVDQSKKIAPDNKGAQQKIDDSQGSSGDNQGSSGDNQGSSQDKQGKGSNSTDSQNS
jgi:stage II sporulation protein Q